jgi:peroxiredoxin
VLHRLTRRVPGPLKRRMRDALHPPMLREGENAPEWNLFGTDGAWHAPGDHWSLLIFYPGDCTQGCTLQLRETEEHAAKLASLGCKIFGFNPADLVSHRKFVDEQGLSFPLLVDEGGAVARQYGALFELALRPPDVIRTVYLVNPARKIRLANRGSPSVAAIVRSIQALQQATRAGM